MIITLMRYFFIGLLFILPYRICGQVTSGFPSDSNMLAQAINPVDYQNLLDQTEDRDKIQSICEEALKGELNNNDKFVIYLNTGVRLYDLEDLKQAAIYLNMAKNLSDSVKDNNFLGKLYDYTGWLAAKNNSYNEAIGYFKVSYQYYIKADDVTKQGNVVNSIGAMYWYLRNYALALSYFSQVNDIGEASNDPELILKGLTNKAIVLRNLAQYADALDCLEKALELNKTVGDEVSRASLLNALGNTYLNLNQFQSAIRCYNEALKLYLKLNSINGIGDCYNNLGEAYLKLGDIDAALKNYGSSLKYVEMENDSTSLAMVYVNMGRAYQQNKAYLRAVSFFERALKIMVSYKDLSLEAEAYLYLAQTIMASNNYVQAESYVDKAIEIARRIAKKATLAECYDTKAELYAKQKRYKDALEYKTLFASLKDSITDEQALINSARMDAVYNLLEKEETISKLEQDNQSKEKDLIRIKETRTLYLIISASLFGCIIFLFLLFRLRRKTSIQLRSKNKELAQLNATKDKFFSIIAHDLKSPFSSLMGFAEMLCLHAETKNTKEVVEYAQVIHNSTKRLLGLVENLLQWSRTQLGTTEYKPMQIDVSIHTNNIVSLLRLNAEEKDIVISPKVDKDLIAWADLNLFSTVLRNLISNAIKFSRVGSVIYVSAQKRNDMIEVAVSDSGVGIRQENLEKLFQVDTAFSTKGTFNEKGTGIGLVLCKEFVEINKGAIWAESELEKGSVFTFTLPLNGSH